MEVRIQAPDEVYCEVTSDTVTNALKALEWLQKNLAADFSDTPGVIVNTLLQFGRQVSSGTLHYQVEHTIYNISEVMQDLKQILGKARKKPPTAEATLRLVRKVCEQNLNHPGVAGDILSILNNAGVGK